MSAASGAVEAKSNSPSSRRPPSPGGSPAHEQLALVGWTAQDKVTLRRVGFDIRDTKQTPLSLVSHLSHYTPKSRVGVGGDEQFRAVRLKASVCLLNHVYCRKVCQVGHCTDGHKCVTYLDKQVAVKHHSDLLYGEVLPSAVAKMMDPQHLAADRQPSGMHMYDLGMGTGKLALQAFLEKPSLKYVVGIELAFSRYGIGEQALLRLCEIYSEQFKLVKWQKGQLISVMTTVGNRLLEFRRGDLFGVIDDKAFRSADIVVFQTEVPKFSYCKLTLMLDRLPVGAHILSYLDLRKVHVGPVFLFEEFAQRSRFHTSWSTKKGHNFFLWKKVSLGSLAAPAMAPQLMAAKSPAAVTQKRPGKNGTTTTRRRRSYIPTLVKRFSFWKARPSRG